MKFVFIVVAVALAATAQGASDFELPEIYQDWNGELLEMPLTPPMAGEVGWEEDVHAEALVADAESEDPTLTLMQEVMDEASAADANAKAAVAAMNKDIQLQKAEAKKMLKNAKAEKQHAVAHKEHRQAGINRFQSLRRKFPSFEAPTEFDEAEDCDACINQFEKNGGCDAWKRAKSPAVVAALVPKGCTGCAHAAQTHCGITKAHLEAQEKHLAPTHYSAVPVGQGARKADADLASGAAADRKEDWKVHEATYHALHPSARRLAKDKAKADAKKPPKVQRLEDAQKDLHHTLDTISETKHIIATPLVKLTLEDAKKSCGRIRAMAQKKCDADAHHTHFFCITEGTKEKACDTEKMNDAAECKVAHESAYNKCFSLWKRAKQNIHDARERAAAPMKHSDEIVKSMAAGSVKCATLMKQADTSCKSAFDVYRAACKSKLIGAMEADFLQVMAPTKAATKAVATAAKAVSKAAAAAPKSGAGKKIAVKAAADSKDALKKAENQLIKETVSSTVKDAMVKCELKKNIAKRTCVKAVHAARDSCDQMTSSGLEDNDNSE